MNWKSARPHEMIPSMHWFWRALIAVVVGVLTAGVIGTALFKSLTVAQLSTIWIQLGRVLMEMTVPVAIYGLLTRYYTPERRDRETRCRVCGYILRGISEPRCPECGERI